MMIAILVLICLLIVIAASCLFFIIGLAGKLQEMDLVNEVKDVKFKILKQMDTNKKVLNTPVPSIETRTDEDLYEEEYEREKAKRENI